MKFDRSYAFSGRFASALKARRLAAGMSHQTLANTSGVSRAAISMIESGKRSPSLVTCHSLCHALGTTVAEVSKEAEP